MKRTVWRGGRVSGGGETGEKKGGGRYLVGVVEGEDAAARLVDVLVAVLGAAHGQRRVHVDVVAREVERDEALEEDGPAREGRRQEHEQARRGAAVRHHVEHGAEARRLLKVARRVAVERVEQARDAVEQRAGARVQRHVVERGEGEDDARVACGGRWAVSIMIWASSSSCLATRTDDVWP